MIDIPYDFVGTVEYTPYSEIVKRFEAFDQHSIIGEDATNKYDLYLIELGNPGKPTLMITSVVHGSEWQSVSYSLSFMEQLRDDSFPDKELRDTLLENFHIAYIPVVNPWGYEETTEYARTTGRLNSTGTNLNRDFVEFKDPETRAVRDVMLEFKPFAFVDLHLIRGRNVENYLMLESYNDRTSYIRDNWLKSLQEYSGFNTGRWLNGEGVHGLSTKYMNEQSNDYTPHTLSYIVEITRPVEETTGFIAPLTDEEIYKFGSANLYLFFKTSIDYYLKYNGYIVSQIERPNGNASIIRDNDGITQMIEEEKGSKTIETTFTRGKEGIVQRIIRKIKSLK